MPHDAQKKLISTINNSINTSIAHGNYDNLLSQIADSRFVLIGEATHGTHEFYQTRIEITKALIEQKDFMAVAIEGDWPDVYQIHRYLQGHTSKDDHLVALNAFQRFPTWMWRNTTMPDFLQWLRQYNDELPNPQKIGFYGLDLYSLNASIESVIRYLQNVDVKAAQQAKYRYACFDHVSIDPQMYGYLTTMQSKKSCIEEVVAEFHEMQHKAFQHVHDEDYFIATQNARIVKNAERYYRSMFEDHVSSWNIRDEHMAETLNIIADHLEEKLNKPAKIVVWAHNSHLGDARATEMGEQGEINIGQLVREQHSKTYAIGFSTYEGTVTAASNWDEPPMCKPMVPGLKGSYEALFHDVNANHFMLNLRNNDELEHVLKIPRLQRAIGVVYRPDTERYSHYFFTKLPYQFDTIIHIDHTTALKPLD